VAELTLPGEARSAGLARRFLASTLTGWGDSGYTDDGALLLTELVTNAALHAKTDIVIKIELKAACLRLAVTDGSPRQPVVRHYSDHSTTGRGLALVTALASRWGITSHPDGSKTVWVELASSGHHGGGGASETQLVDLNAFPDLEESAPNLDSSGSTSLRAA
jgi:anti-sigma regulatory factor (Ser/Thr protein kinase)